MSEFRIHIIDEKKICIEKYLIIEITSIGL